MCTFTQMSSLLIKISHIHTCTQIHVCASEHLNIHINYSGIQAYMSWLLSEDKDLYSDIVLPVYTTILNILMV